MDVKIRDRGGLVYTFEDVLTVHTTNISNTCETWITDAEATMLTRNINGLSWECHRMKKESEEG